MNVYKKYRHEITINKFKNIIVNKTSYLYTTTTFKENTLWVSIANEFNLIEKGYTARNAENILEETVKFWIEDNVYNDTDPYRKRTDIF